MRKDDSATGGDEARPIPLEGKKPMISTTARARKTFQGQGETETSKNIVKASVKMDIITGKLRGKEAKENRFEIRRKSDCKPMNSNNRRYYALMRFFAAKKGGGEKRDEDEDVSLSASQRGRGIQRNLSAPIGTHGRLQVQQSFSKMPKQKGKNDDEEENVDIVQYRLQARKEQNSIWQRALSSVGIATGNSGIYDDGDNESGLKICGVSPNNFVTSYLHWSFRRSFIAVFFSAAVGFFGLSSAFAVLIFLAGLNNPECIYVAGESFGATTGFGNRFADAFALSWTTFATVGYGATFPATSATEPHIRQCTGVTILCTLESFVGILFGSFCGAVLHGKVSRIRSQAQVLFSDPIVIRYGSGVIELDDGEDDDDRSQVSGKLGKSSPNTENRQLPCPLLEFRVVNRLHATKGGEILNATMNIVASIDEDQVTDDMLKLSKDRRRKRRGKFVGRKGNERSPTPPSSLNSNPLTINENRPLTGGREHGGNSMSSIASMISEKSRKPKTLAFDEEADGYLVTRRVFIKLYIETPEHPFFKRIWVARHALNQDSPLLTNEARKAVKLNGNFWPAELNNHEAVRASVQFDQILVSLSGTSNVDANSVYTQKVYSYNDINVGYRFVNLLYHDKRDDRLNVDISVLNDVNEQAGGGGEPFHSYARDSETLAMLGTMMFL